VKITDLLEDSAEALRNLPELAGAPVIVEDLCDARSAVEGKFGKASRCVIVRFGGSAPVKQGSEGPLFDRVGILCECYEKPCATRGLRDGLTLLDVAQHVARALHGAKSEWMTSILFYRGITPIEQLDGGVVCCAVKFDTTEAI